MNIGFTAAATLMLAAHACSGGTEPTVAHLQVLESIAGESLPALEYLNSACGSLVVADTLVLYEGSTGERRTARDVPSWTGAVDPTTCEPAASSPRKRVISRARFTYRQTDDRIEIDFPCPEFASCVPSPHFVGTLSDQGLVIETSQSSRTPLVYRTVP